MDTQIPIDECPQLCTTMLTTMKNKKAHSLGGSV